MQAERATIVRHYQLGTTVPGTPVTLEIFAPQARETGDFSCRLRMEGHRESAFETEVWGIDSLQATMLALKLAGTELYAVGEAPEPHIFLYVPNDDLDIPITPSVRDRAAKRDRKEAGKDEA